MRRHKTKCPFCGSENPLKAYCCINCYKVINTHYKVPIWKMQFKTGPAAVIIAVALMVTSVAMLHQWLAGVEANMTINVVTAEYNLSLQADKLKRKTKLKISLREDIPEKVAVTPQLPQEN